MTKKENTIITRVHREKRREIRKKVAREIHRTFRALKYIEQDIIDNFTGHNSDPNNEIVFDEAFNEIVMFNNNENFGEFVQPIADIASALRAIRYGVSDIINTLEHDSFYEDSRDYEENAGPDDRLQQDKDIEHQRRKASMLQMKAPAPVTMGEAAEAIREFNRSSPGAQKILNELRRND